MNADKRSARSWLIVWGLVGAVVALLLFLELFDPWRSSILWMEVFNFGHVPLFGVISILLLMLTRAASGHRFSALSQYGVSVVIALFLAALSEAVQIGGPRDADIFDLLRDLAGVSSFLLVYFIGDERVQTIVSTLSVWRNRQLLRLVAIAIFVVSALQLMQVGSAWINRNQAYPVLFSFEHGWENTFVYADSATATVVPQSNTDARKSGNHVLRVDYRAVTYAGLILQDLYPDWSSSISLSFAATSLSEQPELLLLRVEDDSTKVGTHDRFERVLELRPGLNEFNIPLSQIELSRLGRHLDLRRIKRIVLFSASDPRREFSVEFDNFRLK